MFRTNITDTFCTGKRAFKSYREASQKASKTSKAHDKRMHPYRCLVCGWYHYGQADRRAAKQMGKPKDHSLYTEE